MKNSMLHTTFDREVMQRIRVIHFINRITRSFEVKVFLLAIVVAAIQASVSFVQIIKNMAGSVWSFADVLEYSAEALVRADGGVQVLLLLFVIATLWTARDVVRALIHVKHIPFLVRS